MPKLLSKSIDTTKQPHYTRFKIQPIKYIVANKLGYMEGNIVKYITRYPFKDGLKDLKKAKHYIEMLIREYKK